MLRFTLFFWFGPGNGHDMALELVYGVDVRCILCQFSTPMGGVAGRSLTEKLIKSAKTKIIIFPRGLTDTKYWQRLITTSAPGVLGQEVAVKNLRCNLLPYVMR